MDGLPPHVGPPGAPHGGPPGVHVGGPRPSVGAPSVGPPTAAPVRAAPVGAPRVAAGRDDVLDAGVWAVVPTVGAATLAACLDALAAQTARVRVLVVADGPEAAAAIAPVVRERDVEARDAPVAPDRTSSGRRAARVEVLALARNEGHAGAARAGCDRALELGARWALLVNDDVVLEPDALDALVECARADARTAIVAPLLLVDRRPGGEAAGSSPEGGERAAPRSGTLDPGERPRARCGPDAIVDSAGLELNLLGQGRDVALGARVDRRAESVDAAAAGVDVLAATGAALLLRADLLRRAGGIEPSWGFYDEDLDLALAARDLGLRVALAPRAIGWHRRSTSVGAGSPRQAYFLGRNQPRLVLRTFPAPEVLALYPLALGRLALRPLETLAAARCRGALRAAPALVAAHLRALRDALAAIPGDLRARRPMRRSTFARVQRIWRWPRA